MSERLEDYMEGRREVWWGDLQRLLFQAIPTSVAKFTMDFVYVPCVLDRQILCCILRLFGTCVCICSSLHDSVLQT
jgi:hypothetical protein